MNSIKGRILLAFLAFCVLITPFVLFSISALKKINSGKALKEQVAVFNINRLKAYNRFSELIDADIKIDSFYQYGTTYTQKEYEKLVASATSVLHGIQVSSTTKDKIIERRLQNINSSLEQLKIHVDTVLQLQRKRGFKDFGLEGTMRQNIHRLEQDKKGISLAENLMLRRREKDFFLRNDPHYAALLNKEADSLLKRMVTDEAANSGSIAILKEYKTSFNTMVALENRIRNQSSGLIQEIKTINYQLDHEVNKLYETVNINLQLLINRLRSYIILFFCITALFATFFTLAFSWHLSKPIQQLIDDMDDAADNNFKGNFEVKTSINVREINQLAHTYNSLAEKIRRQISDLNTKNDELNHLNEKLKESEHELQEASGIKDKFFSIISHDLRGHTGNVLSLAQILNEDSALSGKEKAVFTQYLMDASRKLQLLLDNLLNWAKTQMNDHTLSKKAFNLVSLIEENIVLVADNAARKGVVLALLPTEVSNAYADKNMVDFIIRNLISNALKFTKKGDRITLEVREENNFLEIRVKDTGVGMTEKQITQLLLSDKENSSTKGTQNEIGTGLGFAICKDFIQRNGGAVQITSKKGKGSTFTFTLPTTLTRDSILSS
ncbi:MAG: HAMP domain-containing sensor histidine kinase [Bacteroidota bacterium]